MSFWTRIITLLVVLLSVAYPAACDTRFLDTITVRVFNENYIPVEGARVDLTYQLDRTSAKGYFTATKTTNARGEAVATLQNLEVDPEKVDCNIKINASYDSQAATKTIVAQSHTSTIDFFLEAHVLTLRVVDQDNDPIPGVEIFVQNRSGTTDAFGQALFLVGEGTVHALAKYDIGKIEEEIEVEQPLVHTLAFTFYPLTLRAVDDTGNPLAVVATVEDMPRAFEGELVLEKIARSRPTVKIRYENVEKEVPVDLAVETAYTAVFDLHPPSLVSTEPRTTADRIKLQLGVVDSGDFASGVQPDGIRVNYRYDAQDWQTVRAYSVARNQYVVDIPRNPDAITLFFRIEATDIEGNRANFEGQLPLELSPSVNTTAPPPPPPPSTPAPSFPLPLVVGIGALALLIYLVYRFKLSQGGGS